MEINLLETYLYNSLTTAPTWVHCKSKNKITFAAATTPWRNVVQDAATAAVSQCFPFMVLVDGSFGGKAIFIAVVAILHCFS